MITQYLRNQKRRTTTLILVTAAVIGLTTTSCTTRHETPPEIVAAHSVGALSAGETIRVRFDRDMVSSETLGAEITPSPITLRPKVEGVARWTAPDVLSFEPTTLLEPGARYEARLDIGAITAEDGEPFHFEVEVMEQTLEIMIEGLRTTSEGPGYLELEGILRTADVTVSDAVEQCLEATLEGRSLPIQWTHTDGGRVHRFTVGAITRTKVDQAVTLGWDGAPIGAEMRGSRQIEVVRQGVFRVIGARTVEHPHPAIEIRCSDPVDPEQELLGLIRVSDHEDLRTDIRANVVTISATGGWDDEEMLRVETGLRSTDGQRLASPYEQTLSFQPPLPSVSFPGQGVIVPTTNGLSLPIETTALTAIEIEATQVFENNMAQFFQVNALGESDELRRVGRVIWQDRLTLGPDASSGENRRWALDLSPLVTQHPGGLYRIKIRFNRGDIAFDCSDAAAFPTPPAAASSTPSETSNWDQWEDPSDYSWSELYEHRNNPCHPGFYNSFYDHDIEIERNILLSNLGLVAKQTGGGETIVLATDLRTAQPLAGAEVTLLDYQQQILATGITGPDGMLRLSTAEEAFLLIAHSGDQVGYLKLDDGQSLSLSRFDTGGVKVRQGLKGFIYGERGVWRPGDQMHIGFILHDPENSIPADHPVIFELRNPLDQLVTREVQTVSGQQFFVFEPSTDGAASTGNYLVTVRLGDTVFEKTLKVAMIRPNRLRIALETDQPELRAPQPRLQGLLEATWLHGAEAGNLETRIEAVLRPTATKFTSKPDFIFDDPTRTLDSEPTTLFEGVLDAHGRLRLDQALPIEASSPGKARAILTTRVFEPGGAFSITESSVDVSPFERYVGLRTPPGDAARGMLLTDTEHRVDLALLNQEGRPVEGDVTINLYKISWRWWWEKGGDEGLADFAQSTSLEPIASGKVALSNGAGAWQFSVAYPEWGRFLLLAEDAESGHRTGKVLYIDWPGWAGKARKGAGDSAQVLALSADTDRATVGDEVTVTIPSAAGGTILVSIEKGDTVVHTETIEALAERTPYRFLVTENMTPNIYVGATFIQPHDHPENDLPIRMYGVLPLSIHQPDSRLEPKIEVPAAFKPESTGSITVSEAQARAMSYTVAIVDEGLLGLTGFATPDPWSEMYRKEALGVRTWDLYDDVIGAWGSALEALLAIGGGEDGRVKPGSRKERRFPPMVRFMGPFHLEAGKTATHDIDIPLYLGSVRVMVVAADGNAFGRAGRDVPVRKKVMVLGSMPRQLAPGETLLWPISVWAMNDTATTVKLTTEIEGPASVDGPSTRTLTFSGPGEELVILPLTVADTEGPATFTVTATGGGETSRHTTNLDVRHPARPVTRVTRHHLAPGEVWTTAIEGLGPKQQRHVALEVSHTPPIDLGRRLDQLIHYPYGCLEQTVSAAFPQLYLGRLVTLDADQNAEVERNVQAAIERIRQFQLPGGAMSLWPVASGGFWTSTPRREADAWATSYAGHFLLEAKRAGYRIPAEVLQNWEGSQREAARAFDGDTDTALILQAYRLKTLALGGAPDLGAMNRLRETQRLPVLARWILAATYQHAGRPEAGHDLVAGAPTTFSNYRELGGSYGSEIRDEAIVLETLRLLNRVDDAEPVVRSISTALGSDRSMTTQSIATALRALALNTGSLGEPWTFDLGIDDAKARDRECSAAVYREDLDSSARRIELANPSDRMLYAVLSVRGTPARTEERSATQGLRLETLFLDTNGEPMEIESLEHGADIDIVVTLTNEEDRRLENLALTLPVADAWEIRSVDTDTVVNHVDIRDDRVDLFLDLDSDESLEVTISVTAAFKGRFYLPMITAEAMYDPSIAARLRGRWIEIVTP